MARFECPNCKITVVADVSQYRNIDKAVKIKCHCKTCGHYHSVLLERRQHYRKKVNIPGLYRWNQEKIKRPMTVKNLSRSGLGFQPEIQKKLKIGDLLFVEFHLDNTLIKKKVIVRSTPGFHIGTEFFNLPGKSKKRADEDYDMAIARYTYKDVSSKPAGTFNGQKTLLWETFGISDNSNQ